MKLYLAVFLSAFAVAAALTAILMPLLKRLKAGQYILGYVKEHKDKNGTPTMGGLAFIAAVIIITLAFCGVGDNIVNLTLVIVGGFMIVGFLDDFLKIRHRENQGLKPYQKILFQTAIALIAAIYCYVNGITSLKIPFSGGLSFNIGWGIIPVVIFVFLATVNCVNLTDGLDALAGGTSLAYFSFFGVIAAAGAYSLSYPCFAAAGALAVFLLFNVNRASLFMGDTGSLALGGLVACVSVFTSNALYIPFLGIMFVVSGLTVIIQVIYYKRTGKRVFLMAPLHHHFQMKGYTECKISYAYALVTSLIGILCLIFL